MGDRGVRRGDHSLESSSLRRYLFQLSKPALEAHTQGGRIEPLRKAVEEAITRGMAAGHVRPIEVGTPRFAVYQDFLGRVGIFAQAIRLTMPQIRALEPPHNTTAFEDVTREVAAGFKFENPKQHIAVVREAYTYSGRGSAAVERIEAQGMDGTPSFDVRNPFMSDSVRSVAKAAAGPKNTSKILQSPTALVLELGWYRDKAISVLAKYKGRPTSAVTPGDIDQVVNILALMLGKLLTASHISRTHEAVTFTTHADMSFVLNLGPNDSLELPLLALAFLDNTADVGSWTARTFNLKTQVAEATLQHQALPGYASLVSVPAVVRVVGMAMCVLDPGRLDPAMNPSGAAVAHWKWAQHGDKRVRERVQALSTTAFDVWAQRNKPTMFVKHTTGYGMRLLAAANLVDLGLLGKPELASPIRSLLYGHTNGSKQVEGYGSELRGQRVELLCATSEGCGGRRIKGGKGRRGGKRARRNKDMSSSSS